MTGLEGPVILVDPGTKPIRGKEGIDSLGRKMQSPSAHFDVFVNIFSSSCEQDVGV